MKVAVPLAQHSPRFGQRAEEQTVVMPNLSSLAFTRSNSEPDGTLARSHSGFRSLPITLRLCVFGVFVVVR
jgi:hypothetical protein